MRYVKIIVEKHHDGYVAYPLGLKGVVVGQGNSYEEALADVRSAIRYHIETFGEQVLLGEPAVLDASVAEAIPNRKKIKGSTLRTVRTQVRIPPRSPSARTSGSGA